MIVVAADHGEAFLDHRFFLHKEVYAPLLRVPLIVHDPRESGGRVVSQRVALSDVAPTVLEFAGLPPPADQIVDASFEVIGYDEAGTSELAPFDLGEEALAAELKANP